MQRVFVIFFAALLAAPASADFFSGNKLKELSDADRANDAGHPNALFKSGLFTGYVAGVTDAFAGVRFCPNSEVTSGQANAIVAKYLNNNPEKWNQPATTLVIEAMQNAFPCVKKR